MLTFLLLAVGMLVLSGLSSAAEASVLTLSPAQVETLIRKHRRGSRALQELIQHRSRTIATIVIVNNIANVAGAVLVGDAAARVYGNVAVGIIGAFLTLVIIVFGEVVPKSLGIHYADRFGRAVAPTVLVLRFLLHPIVTGLERLTRVLRYGERDGGTEEEIHSLVAIAMRKGKMRGEIGSFIPRALSLQRKVVADVMTPRRRIVTLAITMTVAEAAARATSVPYSHFPVVGQGLDDVRGIALERSILIALGEGRGHASIGETLLPPLFTSSAVALSDLLPTLKRDRTQIAIVQEQRRDGSRHTVGIITLEDILEELVGEITSEMAERTRTKTRGRIGKLLGR